MRSFPTKKGMMLVVSCALAFPTIAFAKTAHTKVAPIHDVRKIPAAIDTPKSGFVLRQDLFDRNNPNTCSTGPVLKNQLHGAIISEISEALQTFGVFDCLRRLTARVEILLPHWSI
jgi:hypothetical protein